MSKKIILFFFIVVIAWGQNKQSKLRKTVDKFKEYPVNTSTCDSESICFKPVGYFKTPYNQSTGAPRHGSLKPETKATIEILGKYRETLSMLEKYEYIIVLYHFNLTEKWSPCVNHLGQHNFGVFSTRTPKRPNPIGFSIVRVDSIRGCTLYIRGVDAFNNTPVLDIKPYLPSVDIVKSRKNRQAEYMYRHHYGNRIIDSTIYK